jgi:hypothetical protein
MGGWAAWVGSRYTFVLNFSPLFMAKISKNWRISLVSTSVMKLMTGITLLRWWKNCYNSACRCALHKLRASWHTKGTGCKVGIHL